MSDRLLHDGGGHARSLPDERAVHTVEHGAEVTAGTLLRQAREAAGLQIAALALNLKVPVKKLEALEQDRLDAFSGAVFARALAGSICRNLKVDAAPVLARLPQGPLPGFGTPHPVLRRQFHGAVEQPSRSVFPAISGSVWIAGGVLVAGALGLFFWSFVRKPADTSDLENKLSTEFFPATLSAPPGSRSARENVSGRSPDEAAPLSAIGVSDRPAELANTASLTGFFVEERPTDRVGQPAAAPPALAGPMGSSADEPQGTAASLSPPSLSGILALKADGESWIQVTDARGVVLLSRILEPGESVATSGALPMEAVLGRADAVRVEVRGKALDLASVTRDNVARFKVQ